MPKSGPEIRRDCTGELTGDTATAGASRWTTACVSTPSEHSTHVWTRAGECSVAEECSWLVQPSGQLIRSTPVSSVTATRRTRPTRRRTGPLFTGIEAFANDIGAALVWFGRR
jgi:hypothetical protein